MSRSSSVNEILEREGAGAAAVVRPSAAAPYDRVGRRLDSDDFVVHHEEGVPAVLRHDLNVIRRQGLQTNVAANGPYVQPLNSVNFSFDRGSSAPKSAASYGTSANCITAASHGVGDAKTSVRWAMKTFTLGLPRRLSGQRAVMLERGRRNSLRSGTSSPRLT